jgi:hypothetical protein
MEAVHVLRLAVDLHVVFTAQDRVDLGHVVGGSVRGPDGARMRRFAWSLIVVGLQARSPSWPASQTVSQIGGPSARGNPRPAGTAPMPPAP